VVLAVPIHSAAVVLAVPIHSAVVAVPIRSAEAMGVPIRLAATHSKMLTRAV
jgi:hypothetical protein